MDYNKDFKYIGIIGRGCTAASGAVSRNNLDYERSCKVRKFPACSFYEYMLLFVAEEIVNQLRYGKNAVIYTVDNVADAVEVMRKAIKCGQGKNPDAVIRNLTARGGEGEMRALKAMFGAVQLSETLSPVIKVEKAKEIDMLMLDIPEGCEPEPDTLLDFVNGVAESNIRVNGWAKFSRKGAKVKVKLSGGSKVYFLYRNDSSPLGIAKGNMIRHLWSLAPNVEKRKLAG